MIDCESCGGSGIKRRRNERSEFVEVNCEKCGGTGSIEDPELGDKMLDAAERQAAALERIAAALERIVGQMEQRP